MAINKESNGYTIFFAVAMVAIVGTVLTVIALVLEKPQKKNEADKKKMDILAAINVDANRKDAEQKFTDYIVDMKVFNIAGEEIDTAALAIDVKKQFRNKQLADEDKFFPVFYGKKGDTTLAIVPMAGTGLWGPIWGFVALEEDNITVYGASFDHKTETPGLGAEIKETFFEEPWIGQKIFKENGQFTSIEVRKGGAQPGNMHQVDAITGGTITSNGVNEMAKRTFGIYRKFLKPKF